MRKLYTYYPLSILGLFLFFTSSLFSQNKVVANADFFLLDSTTKEACSHGFVKYTIKNSGAKTNYMKDSILNTAAIYFDFNPPVLTNTASTQFSTLTVSSLQEDNLTFKVYPNPTNAGINIQLEKYEEASVTVSTMIGQVVKKANFQGENTYIQLGDLPSGTYLLTIKTAKGFGTVKVFKTQ